MIKSFHRKEATLLCYLCVPEQNFDDRHMLTSAVHQFFTAPADKGSNTRTRLWLGLSLAFSLFYATIVLLQAFSSDYVVQDDARQHVFWTARFFDPALFPNDLTADYFQSVAPLGYTTFYHTFASLGIDPLFLSKCLPMAIALLNTLLAFNITLQILPIPMAGFCSSLLLNHSLWMKDDIVSGTPAAFVYPIFLLFIYALVRRLLIPCLIAIVLQGSFYPQCVFIFSGVLLLQLVRWHRGRLGLSRDRNDYIFSGAGLIVAFLIMLPYALQTSEYGPVISGAEARPMHIFSNMGASSFFHKIPRNYWLCGLRSGMLPSEWCRINYGPFNLLPEDALHVSPEQFFQVDFGLPQVVFTILFPFLFLIPNYFPAVRQVKPNVIVLAQIALMSIIFFFLAHALLFKLHLPNRYTEHSFRILSTLAAGMSFTVIVDAILGAVGPTQRRLTEGRSLIALGLAGSLMALLVVYPHFLWLNHDPFPDTNYVTGKAPGLYQFFAKQPKDIVIASVTLETNNLPTFARRSVLVGNEGFLLPYHKKYYKEMSQRFDDLIKAQYSPDLAQVKQFLERYGVNFWLLQSDSFKPDYLNNFVFNEFVPDLAKEEQQQLQAGQVPALARLGRRCLAFRDGRYRVLDAKCILQHPL
jgi:hypothetical protein